MPSGSSKFAPFSVFCKLASQAPNVTDPLTRPHLPVKIHGICINLRNNVWKNWDGHAHLSPPRGDTPDLHSTIHYTNYEVPSGTRKKLFVDNSFLIDDSVAFANGRH